MSRLQALRQIIDRAIARSEVADDMDPDLMIDVVYGVLWYRLLLDHARTAPPAVMVVRAGPIPRQAPGGGGKGRPSGPVGGGHGLPSAPVGGGSGLPSTPRGGGSGRPSGPIGGGGQPFCAADGSTA
ncbi:TetR-like C-terminal domain-containing protein [Nocardia africana]|uniref:TetR-like C-terminal domain-containing protein n=1 Tax=Nocardia africana TaxID=134964 RepID=UPI0007A4EC13|nr:TetR-like C-terminal domain-containing protein [Nocardia africana]MCC3314806.1 TetR/AcrR family transcriptional regulator C-terminal ligand-binding domain-containing protein [Nocardia africana]